MQILAKSNYDGPSNKIIQHLGVVTRAKRTQIGKTCVRFNSRWISPRSARRRVTVLGAGVGRHIGRRAKRGSVAAISHRAIVSHYVLLTDMLLPGEI